MDLLPATSIQKILLCYKDGVRTVVMCNECSSKYIANTIKSADLSKHGIDDSTRQVDFILQVNYGLYQSMISEDDRVHVDEIVNIPFNYTLGENETEDDVRKFYPAYEFKYKKDN